MKYSRFIMEIDQIAKKILMRLQNMQKMPKRVFTQQREIYEWFLHAKYEVQQRFRHTFWAKLKIKCEKWRWTSWQIFKKPVTL